MGVHDKRSWKRWSVRQLLSLGCTLGERSEVKSRGSDTTMEFSSSSCDFISNLVNNSMSFDLNGNKQFMEVF